MAWVKTLSFIVLSPLIGMAFGFGADGRGVLDLPQDAVRIRRPLVPPRASSARRRPSRSRTAPTTRRRRWASSRGLLVANRELFADPSSPLHWMHLPDLKTIPWWIILSAHAAIGARHADGRLADRADDGQPHHEAEAVLRLLRRDGRGARRSSLASIWGIPVSTTHTITGAIVGVGATQRVLRRPLGRRGRDRLRLDPDDPDGGGDRRAQLRDPLGAHALRRARYSKKEAPLARGLKEEIVCLPVLRGGGRKR